MFSVNKMKLFQDKSQLKSRVSAPGVSKPPVSMYVALACRALSLVLGKQSHNVPDGDREKTKQNTKFVSEVPRKT